MHELNLAFQSLGKASRWGARCFLPPLVDSFSKMNTNPIHDATTSKPAENHDVRVRLADGSYDAAVWTGTEWRTCHGAVEAVQWQEIPGVSGNTGK